MAALTRFASRRLSTTTGKQLMPTHSRLTRNAANWHRDFDVHFQGPLSSQQISQYYVDGYVIVKDIIPAENIRSCLTAIDEMVDELAKDLYKHGLITDLCDDRSKYNTFNRLTAIDKQYPGAAVLIHKKGILPSQFIDLWQLDILNDIAFQLLQPSPTESQQIAANPIWNIRPKLPSYEEGTVPWHQDAAYLDSKCWNVHQLTAWIPLLSVGELEGCMQLIKGGHLSGNIATHTTCSGETWFLDLHESVIEQELLDGESITDKVVSCAVDEGSVLFLGNTIPHRSLENYSQRIRWSLDLRWQRHHELNGLDAFKENLLIRDGADKSFQPDWESWNKINRITVVEKEESREKWKESFEPIIIGPWMHEDCWERVHDNKHTLAFTNSIAAAKSSD